MTAARRRTFRRVATALGVLAAVAMAIAVFVRRPRSAPAGAAPPLPVPVLPADPDPTDRDAPGVLFSAASVDVASTIDGRIETVSVKVGDHVTGNAVLATLDGRMQRDQLAVARAGRRAASAEAGRASVELLQARDRRDRRASVVKVGGESIAVVSAEEASESKHSARAAGARAAAAGAVAGEQSARVRALETVLSETQLRAPFAGIVSTVYVSPGSFVRPGAPAIRIIDSRSLGVRFALPEARAASVHAGDPITLRLDERTIAGRVTSVAPEVEPSSRTVFIEGAVELDPGAEAVVALAGRAVRVATGAR